jgi:hypothetical protein
MKGASPFAYANADPFCEMAQGARVPDFSTSPSIPVRTVDVDNLSNSGSNCSAYLFIPSLNVLYSGSTSASGSAWTWGAAYSTYAHGSQKKTGMVADFSLIRPVAWGIRLSTQIAKLYATGTVHIAYVPLSFNTATWAAPLNFGDLQEMPGYQKLPLSSLCESSVTVTGKFLDTHAFEYFDPATGPTSQQGSLSNSAGSLGWYGICIVLDGVVNNTNATSNQVQFECVIHWEGQEAVTGSTAIGIQARHEHPDYMEMQKVASAVATSPGIYAGNSLGDSSAAIRSFFMHYGGHAARYAGKVVAERAGRALA